MLSGGIAQKNQRNIRTSLMKQSPTKWEVSKKDPSYKVVEKLAPPRPQKSSGLLASDPVFAKMGDGFIEKMYPRWRNCYDSEDVERYSTSTTQKTDPCDGDTTQRRNSSFEHNNLAEEGLCFSEPAPNAAAVNVGLC